MSNTFFKFKQFTIHQDKCAMKVCTDSCLFGAIISNKNEGFKNALDIGTGTGLLSLMFAQKQLNCKIDAIEIDEEAFKQAKENVEGSVFNSHINLYLADIVAYSNTSISMYDVIISNPPFYTNDLKSNNEQRNLAMHNSALSYEDLLNSVNKLLDKNGTFYILIPFSIEDKLLHLAKNVNLFPSEIIRFKQTTSHNYFRSVICLNKIKKECKSSELSIKEDSDIYTLEFKNLLKDYYLNF